MSPFDAALPSTEDLFSVIEAIHDNVAIVDHNGVMRWVSSCFERNYGISRDRVIGRTTYELEAEKVFSPSVAALVLKTRRVVTLTEATRSGQYNIVTGVPIYDDDGDVSFVVSYSVDMCTLVRQPLFDKRISFFYRSFTKFKNFSTLPLIYFPFFHTIPISCWITGSIGIPFTPFICFTREE